MSRKSSGKGQKETKRENDKTAKLQNAKNDKTAKLQNAKNGKMAKLQNVIAKRQNAKIPSENDRGYHFT
jgi:hypothetical protein